MKKFNIQPLDRSIESDIVNKIDNLTKPKGALGRLEDLGLQISLIQHTLSHALHNPHNVLFAADHGILDEGVSVSPKDKHHISRSLLALYDFDDEASHRRLHRRLLRSNLSYL